MKRSVLVHGGWCLAAITSFFLGSQVFPSGGGSPGENTRSDRSSGSKSLRPGQGGAGPAGEVGGPGRRVMGERVAVRGPGNGGLRLSESEVQALGERFRTAASPIERRLAFSRLLEGLTPENAALLRKQIEHLPAHSAEFREFHYAWGAVAGEDAVMFGADTPKPDMAPALAGWAGANPRAAIQWFQNLKMAGDASFDNLL
ncbi:MAG: hypothetical protein GWO24_10485, partial [Akkermansiaceae bacterium]|nr:hypothetical protein [Akkermansiaceae bacterium]